MWLKGGSSSQGAASVASQAAGGQITTAKDKEGDDKPKPKPVAKGKAKAKADKKPEPTVPSWKELFNTENQVDKALSSAHGIFRAIDATEDLHWIKVVPEYKHMECKVEEWRSLSEKHTFWKDCHLLANMMELRKRHGEQTMQAEFALRRVAFQGLAADISVCVERIRRVLAART